MSKKPRLDVRLPVCYGCADRLYYDQNMPIRKKGVTMHFGETFCVGGKKARKFKRTDPVKKVPEWCQKKKSPCELRVYGFKSTEDWMLHEQLCYSLNRDITPEGRRYAVEYELHTELTAQEFAKRCEFESSGELLHVAVHDHYVVEIDDGLKPVFFYKTSSGYELMPLFDAVTARKNKKEVSV